MKHRKAQQDSNEIIIHILMIQPLEEPEFMIPFHLSFKFPNPYYFFLDLSFGH